MDPTGDNDVERSCDESTFAWCSLYLAQKDPGRLICESGFLMITGTSDFVLPTNTGYWYFAGTDGSAVTQPDGSIRYSPGASGYATAFVTESGRILTGIPYCACYTSVEAFPSSLLQDCARIKKPNMFEAIKEECMDTSVK